MKKTAKSLAAVLLVGLLLSACTAHGIPELSSGQSTPGGTAVVQQPGNEHSDSPFTLFVDVLDDTTATMVIDGVDQVESVVQAYNWSGQNAPDLTDVQYQMNIELPDYSVIILFDKAREDFLMALLHGKDSGQQEEQRPDIKRSGDRFEIKLQLPEGAQSLREIDRYELMLFVNGAVVWNKSYSIDDMAGYGDALMASKVFPQEVYSTGFEQADGDTAYFTPTTDDYVLIKQTRTDGSPVYSYMLLSFDEAGYVTTMQQRITIISGQQSGPNGLEPVYADEQIMQGNLESYLHNGYQDAAKTGYSKNSAAVSGYQLYLNLSESNVFHENAVPLTTDNRSIRCTKEEILTKQTLRWSDHMSENTFVYASKPELTSTQTAPPVYCKAEDFFLLPYITLSLSQDYRVSERKDGDVVVLVISYFNEQGMLVGEETLYYKADILTMPAGVKPHPTNLDIMLIASTRATNEEKRTRIAQDKRDYLDNPYTSYAEAIAASAPAVYYSNPNSN